MYQARLETTSGIKNLKDSAIVMPISLGNVSDQHSKSKINANFESLSTYGVGKVCIVITDVLQRHNIQCQYPDMSLPELHIKAFELGVEWLRGNAELILNLKVPYEIIGWHQIIYETFSETKIHELFITGNLNQTLCNIDNWALNVKNKFLDHAAYDSKNKDYILYLDKTNQLIKNNKAFKVAVITTCKKFKPKEQKNLEVISDQNDKYDIYNKQFVVEESAVYWLWGEKKLFTCSMYPNELNPAIKHIQSEVIGMGNFNHIRIKYDQLKTRIAVPTTNMREKNPINFINSMPNNHLAFFNANLQQASLKNVSHNNQPSVSSSSDPITPLHNSNWLDIIDTVINSAVKSVVSINNKDSQEFFVEKFLIPLCIQLTQTKLSKDNDIPLSSSSNQFFSPTKQESLVLPIINTQEPTHKTYSNTQATDNFLIQ